MTYEQNLKEKAAIIDLLWFEACAGKGFCETIAAKVLEWMAEGYRGGYNMGRHDEQSGKDAHFLENTIIHAGLKPTTNDNN